MAFGKQGAGFSSQGATHLGGVPPPANSNFAQPGNYLIVILAF